MAENIKIIRLQGGEDIVADCLEDDGYVILDSPMHLIFKRGPAGNKIMVLLPWLPVELIHENIASIPHKEIVFSVSPRKELIDYYLESVEIMNDQMQYSLNINDSMEDENSSHQRMFDEMLEQAIEEKKNSNIH